MIRPRSTWFHRIVILLVLAGTTAFNSRVPAQTNGVLRELFANIAGGSIPDLTNSPSFPGDPTDVFLESAFEAPNNFSDYYGQRMRALIRPPVTGSYTFWIASDDNSVLYLSTDETPNRKVMIAYENSWAGWRAYNTHVTQKSAPITLTSGARYYIEALQKEGAGGDNLSVAWQKPGDAAPVDGSLPISGDYLVAYGLGSPVIIAQPTNVVVVETAAATFAVRLAVKLGCLYQWRRDGTPIPGATNSVYTMPVTSLADNGSRFACAISNWFGNLNSATATLTVNPDVSRPYLVSAGTLGDSQILTVIFSEPVEPASATAAANYTISGGVSVSSATFGLDPRTIILTTSPMAQRINYTLTVNNVRDRATTPNSILGNSQLVFSLDPVPLDISLVRPNPEPAGASSRHGPIVISEIMYHPAARGDGRNLEFIELFNSNPFYEDIGNFRISGDIDFIFPTNTIMAGRSVLVLAASPADVQSVYGVTVFGAYTNKLPNASGTVRLRNRQGGIIFEVNYSSEPPWPAAADGAGHSLLLAWPSVGERDPAAWSASSLIGGSPGRLESVSSNPYRTVVINELLAHTDPPDVDYIELYNYSGSAVDIGGCILTDDPDTNKFVIPSSTLIQPLGFIVFDQAQLGFSLNAAGETIYFKDASDIRVVDCLRFGGQENGVTIGRHPDGASGIYRLASKTPGGPNARRRQSEVVINELMYAALSGVDDDQYIELYNRGTSPVDLGRWRLEGGVKYTMPWGTVVPANGYMVVARNAMRLMSNNPTLTGLNTVGDFSGSLARGGERVSLSKPDQIVSTNSAGATVTNQIHIVVDEVTYRVGGRWGEWSHGGGSSLELVDPDADHRLAANWADSNETAKAPWTTIECTGVLDNGNGTADSLQIDALGPGEYLVDNVEVFAPGGSNLISNPGFETGVSGWAFQGNHEDSGLETREGYNSTQSLHVRAAGRGDTGANRIRTSLTSALSPGQTATIRAKVRWLAGHNEILLRLRGNWLEATGTLATGTRLGTPGVANSRARLNSGPAIADVKHSPVLPYGGQALTVSAKVEDPDGLAALFLKYRIDPSTNLILVNMANNGAGLFSAVIPGQPAGTLVAFSIEALDNHVPRQASRFPNNSPKRECLVRFGDPVQTSTFGTYRLWMTRATFDEWCRRERLSNKPLDCTFVYGGSRVIYNVGGQYAGSPWHAPGFDSPTGNVCDYLLNFPEDDPLLGETDATLQWPGNGGGDNTYQREQSAYWIAEQIGLPYCYRRPVNLFVNGVRRAEMYEDVQQPNGDMMDEFYPEGKDGDLHKIQIWFEFDDAAASFTANGASLRNVTTTGGQKELPFYRWTFGKRATHKSANDYDNLFSLVDVVNYSGLGVNYRRQLESKVDFDNWLKTYAVEHVVGNSDSFAYGGGQNMYAYKPLGDRWKMLIWDIDFAFSMAEPTSDVFQGIGRSNGIDLGEAAYKRRYWQILQDLAAGPLAGTKLFPLLDAKYNAMLANGRSIESPASIKTYVSQRRAHLLSLISSNALSNFSITLNGGLGFSTSQNLINLTGTAPIDVRTITINGVAFDVTWTSISNWSAQIALAPGTNNLLVQGWGSSSNAVAGASASIPVNYTGQVESAEGTLIISEIMYNPVKPDAGFVEIYNGATNSFDISFWKLNGAGFVFPGGTVVGARSYLAVPANRLAFASAYGATIPLAGEFGGRLDNNGETLQLVRPGSTPEQDVVVDEVRYESCPPWPAAANGSGPSLQLVDLSQDNNRVANWGVATNTPVRGPQWRYVVAPGAASSSSLYMYLQAPGEVYIDDVKLVAGTVPENGPNLLGNGDFESTFPGPWFVSANLSGSGLSTMMRHSGASSLHMVANAAGTSRTSSIYQDISPALTLNAPYTLSCWVMETTNGGTLTLRLSNSGIITNVNLLPGAGTTVFATATPGAPNSIRTTLPTLPALWLNEVSPNNVSGPADRFGHRHPWVELYNSGRSNINLGGVFLTSNYSNLLQWPFPSGTSIASGQYLVVWADGNPVESVPGELHTSFALPLSSGAIAMVSTNGGGTNVLDYLNYAGLQVDRSYGAFPNGSPSRRQQFYFTTPGGTNNPAAPQLNVAINEWMADNQATISDPADGDFEDWFEIYNRGDAPVDLSGLYLGSSLTNRTQFRIPSAYIVPAHGHLLVWADDETGQNNTNRADLHVNFKLSKNGDGIGLFAPDVAQSCIDFVAFGAQAPDASEGRFPDGSSSKQPLTLATPGTSNFLVRPNMAPVISAVPSRSIFEGQVAVFQVVASDTDVPAQQISFSLDLGAPAGAAINPDTGLFAWRPDLDQTPSTNIITVRATDNGQPPLSATTTFEIRVLLPPRITSVQQNISGGYFVQIATIPDKTYQLQYKNDLMDSDWVPLTPGIYALGDNILFADSSATGSRRFYRVVVLE